tara:strand:+ start:10103 stop:10438 length:336 start_codon:yes stop_codon:yes gene_type:complete
MKTQSAKAKGRNLQKWVRDLILESYPALEPDDVRSTSMGAGGEDVQLSPAARKCFPYSVECKNVEKLNVWAAYEQAEANSGDYEPLLIMKKNRKKPLVVMDAETFINLTKL